MAGPCLRSRPPKGLAFNVEALSFVDRVWCVVNASVDYRTCLGYDPFSPVHCLTVGHSKKAPGWLARANQCRSKPSVSRRTKVFRSLHRPDGLGTILNWPGKQKKRPQAWRAWGRRDRVERACQVRPHSDYARPISRASGGEHSASPTKKPRR
jgi:hypothetical protein